MFEVQRPSVVIDWKARDLNGWVYVCSMNLKNSWRPLVDFLVSVAMSCGQSIIRSQRNSCPIKQSAPRTWWPSPVIMTRLSDLSKKRRLVFAVCPEGIKNFRMIERHYFKRKLIKSFDFTFGYCIPNSVNTWESVYTVCVHVEAVIAILLILSFVSKMPELEQKQSRSRNTCTIYRCTRSITTHYSPRNDRFPRRDNIW